MADVGTGSYWRVNGLITRGEGYEVVNNNMIWENCSYDDTNMYIGVWGHGVYLDNNSWANAMSDNRELYVATVVHLQPTQHFISTPETQQARFGIITE